MNLTPIYSSFFKISVRALIVGLLATCVVGLLFLSRADARLVPIDWLHDELSYEPASGASAHENCVWQDRQIAAYGNNRYSPMFTEFPTETVHLCVYSTGSIQYGQYSRDALDASYHYVSTTERAIAVSLDGGQMIPISNIPWNVRLLGSDGGPFAYTEPLYSGNGSTLKLYDNLVEHIHISQIGNHANYEIDSSYYTYRRTDGQDAKLDGVGVSSNGKWLSFAINNFGVMRLNVETKEVQRVASYVYRNSAWPVQGAETSITDDGRYILQAGTNVSFNIIAINDACGLIAQEHDIYDVSGMGGSSCPTRILNPVADINSTARDNGLYIYSRMFIDENVVPARIVYYDGNAWGSLAVSNDRLYYLALGDSYAAGEGDVTLDGADHYLLGTNIYGDYRNGVPRETCHISTRSYPMRIAEAMQLTTGADMRSIACSGAATGDVLSQNLKNTDYIDESYSGQATQYLVNSAPRLAGLSNTTQLQADARSNYIPGRVQQIELIKKAQPLRATIMMGGNDLGFGDVLTTCATNTLPTGGETCDYAYGSGLTGQAQKIHDLYPELVDFYKDIKEVSPRTTIYVIGYPQFMDASGERCPEMLDLYTKAERQSIHSLISYANGVIHNAALDAGVKYIDVSDALTGKQLCGSGTGMTGVTDLFATMIYTEYMKSLTMTDSTIAKYGNIFPSGELHSAALKMYIAERAASLLSEYLYSPATMIADVGQELSHPNAIGHEAIFNVIKSGLGEDLLDSTACNQIVSCPGGAILGQPNVASYIPGLSLKNDTVYIRGRGKVVVGHKDSTGKVIMGALALGQSLTKQFIRIAVGVVGGTVDPSKPVTVEIHSEPIVLGMMTRVGEDYELITSLPQGISVGQHVLHIKGTLMDGNFFDIDSPVFVEGPAGDIDGDGIADSIDSCAFGVPSGVDSDRDGIDDSCDLNVQVGGVGISQAIKPASSELIKTDDSDSGNSTLTGYVSKSPLGIVHTSEGTQRPATDSERSSDWLYIATIALLAVLISCSYVIFKSKRH